MNMEANKKSMVIDLGLHYLELDLSNSREDSIRFRGLG